MSVKLEGFQRKLHHTRYAKKALNKESYLIKGQPVVVLTKDGKYPVRELGKIDHIIIEDGNEEIKVTHLTDELTIAGKRVKVAVVLDSGDYETTFPGDLFIQDLHNVDILLETEWEETAERVSKAVASVESEEKREQVTREFLESIANFHLVPAGRILTGAGDDSKVTLFNCYVIDVEKPPQCPETGVDSRQAIFHHMGRISEIMARGGGVGTCLSVFRPKYSALSQTKGRSTGAVYIGNMFSSLTDFIEQGNRRGAQMLTIHDWHPDVFYTNDSNDPDYYEDFIGAKHKPGFMEGNNSSVLISDAFMEAVEKDLEWELIFPDTTFEKYNEEWDGDIQKWKEKGYPIKVYRRIKARDMWSKIMKSNKESAEPGVLYIDRINEYHNGWYLGKVKATNPCGEQPILGNSTCNLSAVNLGRMVKVVGEDEYGPLYEIDWELLKETVRRGVRFLDNVIDLSYYFDKDMEDWQKGERRLGLGILGLHDMLIALRVRYGSEEGNKVLEEVFRVIRDTAYRTSVELAKEKGPFPFLDVEKYLQSGTTKLLPEDIREDIKKYGIRNLTLLTIAPTGTTGSLTPSLLDPLGSVSTGIEPHFAMKYERLSRVGKTTQYAGIAKAFMDRNPHLDKLPDYFVGAMDLTPEEHVTVQAVAQKYICSSISKTVNAPRGYTVEQVTRAYTLGYKMGLKGMTIYVDGSRDEQILSLSSDEKEKKENNNEEEKHFDSVYVVDQDVDLVFLDGPVDKEVEIINEQGKVSKIKPKHKYADWKCPNCGSTEFHLVEGCPKCVKCGAQSCSL